MKAIHPSAAARSSRAIPQQAYSLWAACLLIGCGLAALALVGCSSGGVATAAPGTDPAKATVTAFLEAIKRGDDAGAGDAHEGRPSKNAGIGDFRRTTGGLDRHLFDP